MSGQKARFRLMPASWWFFQLESNFLILAKSMAKSLMPCTCSRLTRWSFRTSWRDGCTRPGISTNAHSHGDLRGQLAGSGLQPVGTSGTYWDSEAMFRGCYWNSSAQVKAWERRAFLLLSKSALTCYAGLQENEWIKLSLKKCTGLGSASVMSTRAEIGTSRRIAHPWQIPHGFLKKMRI